MDNLLGIDFGTSGTKLILMSLQGEIIARAHREYDIKSPQFNWSEQDPRVWWQALEKCVQEIKAAVGKEKLKTVKAIGLSGQMHGAVFVDKKGEPLYPCILWADNRSEKECEIIKENLGSQAIYKITGNPITPTFTAPKIMWFKNNKTGLYRKTHKILMPKDFINYKLTGKFQTDFSDASGTLLFNIKEKKWSSEIFEKLQLDMNKHPEIKLSSRISASLTVKAAERLDLKPGIPVMVGAGDLACGALGSRSIEEGSASVTIGTAGQVVVTSEQIHEDSWGKVYNFCHGLKDKYFNLASILCAGLSLKWFKNNISQIENIVARESGQNSFQVLLQGIENVPPGAKGLIFLPHLNGAGTPHMDNKARGVFVGLTPDHSKKEMIRAILEGVTYGLRECLAACREVGIDIEDITVAAGGAKSKVWQEIQANIFNQEISTLQVTDTAPLGAAIIAAVGQGKFDNLEDASQFYVREQEKISPQSDQAEIYSKYYTQFKKLYPDLKDFFNTLYDLPKKEVENK